MFVQHTNFGNQSVLRCGFTNGKHNSGDHIHEFCEMEMVIEGEIEITVDGKKQVARAGDIAIIPPFKVHSFYTPNYVKQTIFVISNNLMPSSVSFDELCRAREISVFHAPDRLWSFLIESGFHSDYAKVYDPEKDAETMHWIRSVIYLILCEYWRAAPISANAPAEKALSRILIYMSRHFREPITQSTVGAALGYSAKYVSNCFRALKGFGFRDVLNSTRVVEAKRLLSATDFTNVEIALECGFSSVSTFHQVFLAAEGLPPKQYREKIKTTNK